MPRLLLIIALVYTSCSFALSQEVSDSTQNKMIVAESGIEADGEIEVIETDTLRDRPNTAALYSAVLPGLGQIYNKQYWKLPILYGGSVVLAYFLNYNHQNYIQYRDGLIAINDQDERTEPFDPSLDSSDYERATDYWRRNRDLLIIGALLVYLVNIVDAHVDAHLDAFTISDDISMRVEPDIDQTAMNTGIYGLSLKLTF
jgi:hypothetical protein